MEKSLKTAHEIERFHLDPRADDVVRGCLAPLAAIGAATLVDMGQHVEIVLERAHPRRHLFFFGARQETDVLADRYRDPSHDDFGKALAFEHLGQPCGERQQRLAGTGLAEQGDEVNVRIHQQVQCEILFAVARCDSPDGIFRVRVIDQRFQDGRFARDFLDDGSKAVAFQPDEFVDQHLRAKRPVDLVVGLAVLLPRLHALAVLVPEIGGQGAGAGVEDVGILEYLVVEVILGQQVERARLDAHVDVFGHQNDRAPGEFLLQVDDDRQDLVVDLGGWQALRQFCADRFGLQEQAAAGQFLGGAVEVDAFLDVDTVMGEHFVKRARSLAGVAGDFRHALLVVVEFFQCHDRQEDVMLLETIKATGVVHQHVGVEDENLGYSGLFGSGWLARHEIGLCRRLKGFDEIENFPGVVGHLDAAPLATQNTLAVDDEGAALDATHLFAIHVFHFHDRE